MTDDLMITAGELQAWLSRWVLKPVEAAKVLRIQKSKTSEYLSGDRLVPPYIAAHIEIFDQLPDDKAMKLIQRRPALFPMTI